VKIIAILASLTTPRKADILPAGMLKIPGNPVNPVAAIFSVFGKVAAIRVVQRRRG
jgi:hypothetical protein